mmetsp:Transcript_53831/g.128237  ORF Transcript_53831/g.128237 Transcript_53831/m.128237 type:complete len:210 (-) Transcript_53831:114-743(-)
MAVSPARREHDAPLAASPEQVRRKWDALLTVINDVNGADGFLDGGGGGNSASMRPPLRAARELLQSTTTSSPKRARSNLHTKAWNDRFHLDFSVVNDKINKNVRSYFDRPRMMDNNGLTLEPPLRPSWRLDEPENEPTRDGSSSGSSLAIQQQRGPKSNISKAMSTPELHATGRKPNWNQRHHIMFAKDNRHFHPNFRDYFDRPRELEC